MSYDLRFAVKIKDTLKDTETFAVIAQPELSSPTYNVGPIFRAAMDFDFKQGEFYNIIDLIPHIERGIHELTFNAKNYKHLEPSNGWGTTDTVLHVLESIMTWIREDYPYGWNCNLPLDYIYMAW